MNDRVQVDSFSTRALMAVAVALALLGAVFLGAAYYGYRWYFDRHLEQVQSSLDKARVLALQEERSKLTAIMEPLFQDRDTRRLMRAGDRQGLLDHVRPVFEQWRELHDVTHLYFIRPDRRMLLRAHHPQRFDDRIERFTLREAERTRMVSAGLEMGALGMFTLRVVKPWVADGTLLGYVETGSEFDVTLSRLHELANVDTFMLVDKKLLDSQRWKEGMRMIGRDHDWERFRDYVLVARTKAARLELVDAVLADLAAARAGEVATVDGKSYFLRLEPFHDVSGREVGWLLVSHEVTAPLANLRRMLSITLLLGGALSLLIVFGLYRHLRGLGRALRHAWRERDDFADRSSRDSMTGLYNHRYFVEVLGRELEHARASGRPLSLLMLDVDHFKWINDSFGHLCGDRILTVLAERLLSNSRSRDVVARYGGEEFVVLLIDLAPERAREIVRRMRSVVSDEPIVVDGVSHHIRLSGGLASWPADGDDAEGLIRAADEALSAAKQGGRDRLMVQSQSGPQDDGKARLRVV